MKLTGQMKLHSVDRKQIWNMVYRKESFLSKESDGEIIQNIYFTYNSGSQTYSGRYPNRGSN